MKKSFLFAISMIAFVCGCNRETETACINAQYNALIEKSNSLSNGEQHEIENEQHEIEVTCDSNDIVWKTNGVLTLKDVKLIDFKNKWQFINSPKIIDEKRTCEVKNNDVMKIGHKDCSGRILQFTYNDYIFSILFCKNFGVEICGWRNFNSDFIQYYNKKNSCNLTSESVFWSRKIDNHNIYIQNFKLNGNDSFKVYRTKDDYICIKFNVE